MYACNHSSAQIPFQILRLLQVNLHKDVWSGLLPGRRTKREVLAPTLNVFLTPAFSCMQIMDPSMQPVALQDLDLRRTIGTGSFGRVRLAVFNERAFALKRVKKVNAIRLQQVDRVHTEKRLLASVDHPFIIRLMGSYQDHANVYLLMEFASGGELFSHLRRAGRFPKDTARFYAAQITLALEYLHSLHVVYRGLKPEDVLLDRIGNCKVSPSFT